MHNAVGKQFGFLATIFVALIATAQQPPVNSPLLDHLSGKWVLQGTVGKQSVTHDFDAEWVLQHHYLRFNGVSRDKNDKGEPSPPASPRNPAESPRPKRMSSL